MLQRVVGLLVLCSVMPVGAAAALQQASRALRLANIHATGVQATNPLQSLRIGSRDPCLLLVYSWRDHHLQGLLAITCAAKKREKNAGYDGWLLD